MGIIITNYIVVIIFKKLLFIFHCLDMKIQKKTIFQGIKDISSRNMS